MSPWKADTEIELGAQEVNLGRGKGKGKEYL